VKTIISAVLALLVLSLAARVSAANYSDRSTRYTFTGNFQTSTGGARQVETLTLLDLNSGYDVFINTVDALRDRIIPKGYISQSLLDCIGNPARPHHGLVEIVSPVSRIGNKWITIPLPEAVCKQLPR
jgi:hypothetical protein